MQLSLIDIIRNIKGRYDLFCVLLKWDRVYRKEVIITIMALMLITYSVIDMDSIYDYVALALEVGILMMQFGSEMSILPRTYRPNYAGENYTFHTCTHIWHNFRTYPITKIKAPQKEEDIGFTNPIIDRNFKTDTPLVSNKLDDKIYLTKAIKYKESYGENSYIRSNLQILYIALRVGNKLTHTTNGKKLALHGLTNAILTNKAVNVRKSYYFDALLTAEAFRSRLLRKNLCGKEEVYVDLTSYFPVTSNLSSAFAGRRAKTEDMTLRLKSKFYEEVSGHIGITSLILTENNKIAMLYQGAKKVIDAKKVSFGGSGSMDYDDIVNTNHPIDLRDAIRYGMTREVSEETNMEDYFDDILKNTKVIGFFRWLDRCGKPEFVGITKTGSVPFAKTSSVDGDEITKFEEMPIEIKTMQDFKKAIKYVEENKIPVSLSSLMALHRLAIIADYNKKTANDKQKQIYKDLKDFIFKK